MKHRHSRHGRGRARRGLTGLVVAALAGSTLAGTTLAGPATAAPGDATYLGQIGHPGHAGVYAWGVATLPNGNIIVGDYWNYRMHEYTVDGTLVATFGSRGDGLGQNNAPHGIAVDPRGDVYVSDLNNTDIDVFRKIDGTWQAIAELPTYAFPPGTPPEEFTEANMVTQPIPYAPRLDFDADGRSFMVNSHTFPTEQDFRHRVVVRSAVPDIADPSLQPYWYYASFIGEGGTPDYDFGVLRGIDVSAGKVWLVDAGRSRIRVLDAATGAQELEFGSKGTGPGQFGGDVRGIAVDQENGWVYVVDTTSAQIEKFDLTGNHLTTWGSKGTGPGQFGDGGREIALAPDPRDPSGPPLVVTPDFGNNRVIVFDSDGNVVYTYPTGAAAQPPDDGFNQAQDVSVRPDGAALYTADTFNHRVQRFSPTDPDTAEATHVWGTRGRDSGFGMNYPRGVSVDPENGDVWLLNTRSGDVKVYTATGQFKFSFGSWGTGPQQLNYARGIEVTDDRVFIADSNNLRISIWTKSATNSTRPTHWKNVACAPNSGGLVLKGCTDVVEGANGELYAAAHQEHRIYHYRADGSLIRTFGRQGSANGQFRGPYGLAFHDGLLYVSEAYNHRISVFQTAANGTNAPTYVSRFGSRGEGDGQFQQPKGIDVADNGRLYVMDHFNERVQVFQVG